MKPNYTNNIISVMTRSHLWSIKLKKNPNMVVGKCLTAYAWLYERCNHLPLATVIRCCSLWYQRQRTWLCMDVFEMQNGSFIFLSSNIILMWIIPATSMSWHSWENKRCIKFYKGQGNFKIISSNIIPKNPIMWDFSNHKKPRHKIPCI